MHTSFTLYYSILVANFVKLKNVITSILLPTKNLELRRILVLYHTCHIVIRVAA